MTWRLAPAMTLALGLAACATTYQKAGLTGGYDELKLSEGTYRVTVNGNGYTSKERAENIALLRAAELTIGEGYERFLIVGGSGVEQQVAGVTPTSVNVVRGRGWSTAVASGGEAILKPGGSIVIRMVRKTDPAFASALDARLIESQLRPKLAPS